MGSMPFGAGLAVVLVTGNCGGSPAAPAPVAPPHLVAVIVSPRSPVIPVHDSVHFSAIVRRSDGQDVSLPTLWIASGGNITPSGDYTPPDSAGDFQIIAAVMGQNLNDTVKVTVIPDTTVTVPPDSTGTPPDTTTTPPPQPPDTTPPPPNEPSGMTMLTERGFDAKVENGWNDRGDDTFSIVQDSTAPHSPLSVGQALFNPRMACGTAPINTGSPFFSSGPRTIYVSFWIKMDPIWYGNISSVNKVFFIYIAGAGRVVMNMHTVALGGIVPEIRVQAMGVPVPAISWNAMPNLGANAQITRGQWAHIELELVANTPGQLDGQMHFWLNGVKVGQYLSVGFSSATETGSSNVWQRINWTPTYGGGCNGAHAKDGGGVDRPTVDQFPVPQWMRLDHVYISGKN